MDFSNGVEDKDVSGRCDIAAAVRKRRPGCRVYLVCEEGHPEKLAALDKAAELTLIDGYCIGDLDPQQMRAWLAEAAESMRAAESPIKRPGGRIPGTKTRRTTNSFYEGGNDLCNEQKAKS